MNNSDWKVYKAKAIKLIGSNDAWEFKNNKRTWYEVYIKAYKIDERKRHQELRNRDEEAYIKNVDSVCKQRAYELIGKEEADKLKRSGKEWYQVYNKAMRLHEYKQIQALMDKCEEADINDIFEHIEDDD